jgi:hypothetical protein
MAVPISNVTRRAVYAPSGTGGVGPYAFTFEILANTDIAVFKDDVLLTLTTHYTVTINANGTGSVTITAAGLALSPTSPTQYAIVGNRTIARATDFTTGGDFFANTLNDELDQQTIFAQQNAEGLTRALTAPQTDPTTIDMTLPRAADRANKTLAFDAVGDPTLGISAADVANAVTYATNAANSATAAASSASSASSSASAASSSASTASTQASNASTSASNASTSASGASTSATNAATSASTATTQATNASTSASNASTSATNAASSASAASTSASNASASASSAASAQTAAEAARDSALAAYDNFDDRYLGAKSSNPTLDNDGNALLAGALYFNTVVPEMRLWTGSAWVAAYVSGTGFVDLTSSQTIAGTKTFSSGASIEGLTVGRGAGAVATNTAVGASALQANTTGQYNTAIGYQANYSNTTANGSTAVGNAALYTNTGANNVGVGNNALYYNTTGTLNVAVGTSALQANTTASNNTAVGYQSLYTNTGGNNTALGFKAAFANTTGTNIVAIGDNAFIANTTGGQTVAVGTNALVSNTTGSYNVALGQQALNSNTTASNNTAVGYQAGYTNVTGIANTFTGYQAGYTSNASSVNGYNTATGYQAGKGLTTGNNNSFFGLFSGELITTGGKNSILGAYNGNQGGLDIRTASNYIVLSDGDGNPRLIINGSTGYFQTGLGASSPYNATTASAANVNIFSDGALYRSTSALKYKQDIRDIESIDINLLRGVRYKSKCKGDDQTKDYFGIVADEVDAAGIKELVSYGAEGEVEGFQYERLTVVLLKKLQTLDAEFKAYVATHP